MESKVTMPELAAGLSELERLAIGEYEAKLMDVIAAKDELAFKRVGRLMAVWLKEPFATPLRYNPDLPQNWAKSNRAWEIHSPTVHATTTDEKNRLKILDAVASEWDRPVAHLAEFNILQSISKRLRPVVCGDSKAFKDVDEIAKQLEKQGTHVSTFTPRDVLSSASLSIAGYLVNHVDFLSLNHLPLVTGATLLISCLGYRELCSMLEKFEKSYLPAWDRAAGNEQCAYVDPKSKKHCLYRVRQTGALCWFHQPISDFN